MGDLPGPGIEPASPALAGGFFPTEPSGKPLVCLEWTSCFHHQLLLPVEQGSFLVPTWSG